MPNYAYKCLDHGHHVEVHQSFDDAPLTICPECGGTLRKQFPSVGVVFKGSGFYRTDSRSGSSSSSLPSAKTKSEGAAAPGKDSSGTPGSAKGAPAAKKGESSGSKSPATVAS